MVNTNRHKNVLFFTNSSGRGQAVPGRQKRVDKSTPRGILWPVMKIETIVVGAFQVNCYLYWDESAGDGIILDPGDEETRIFGAVRQAGFLPKAVLLTHGHVDHIAAVAAVKAEYDIPLFVGRGEEDLLANPSANVSELIGHPVTAPTPDHLLEDEELVSVGSVSFRVLATPGHSPGGVCYLDERAGVLFSGDTLFWGSIGRTDFPGCSHQQLIDSIYKKILPLPDSVVCYPGHGPKTTVGGERVNNPFLSGGHVV